MLASLPGATHEATRASKYQTRSCAHHRRARKCQESDVTQRALAHTPHSGHLRRDRVYPATTTAQRVIASGHAERDGRPDGFPGARCAVLPGPSARVSTRPVRVRTPSIRRRSAWIRRRRSSRNPPSRSCTITTPAVGCQAQVRLGPQRQAHEPGHRRHDPRRPNRLPRDPGGGSRARSVYGALEPVLAGTQTASRWSGTATTTSTSPFKLIAIDAAGNESAPRDRADHQRRWRLQRRPPTPRQRCLRARRPRARLLGSTSAGARRTPNSQARGAHQRPRVGRHMRSGTVGLTVFLALAAPFFPGRARACDPNFPQSAHHRSGAGRRGSDAAAARATHRRRAA